MVADFDGRVAVVTGGASGIGRATALALAQQGAFVTIVDLGVAGGNEAVKLIKDGGGQATFLHCDVSSSAMVKETIEKIVSQHGRLDCAVNAAGIEGSSVGLDDAEENWDRVMAVNLKGVWLCLREETAQMAKQGSGAVVNLASAAGLVGTPRSSAYCASKHGVVGLTKSAALIYADKGIRINAVCPGVVDTPMVERIFAGSGSSARDATQKVQPIGRMAQPEEVAQAIVWLCSKAASFVTGTALAVDGGWTAQ